MRELFPRTSRAQDVRPASPRTARRVRRNVYETSGYNFTSVTVSDRPKVHGVTRVDLGPIATDAALVRVAIYSGAASDETTDRSPRRRQKSKTRQNTRVRLGHPAQVANVRNHVVIGIPRRRTWREKLTHSARKAVGGIISRARRLFLVRNRFRLLQLRFLPRPSQRRAPSSYTARRRLPDETPPPAPRRPFDTALDLSPHGMFDVYAVVAIFSLILSVFFLLFFLGKFSSGTSLKFQLARDSRRRPPRDPRA